MSKTVVASFVAIVAVLAMLAHPAMAVTGTLGAAVAVSANTATTVNFVSLETLVITSDTSGTVTVTSAPTASLALPSGFVTLSAGIGYNITFNPSSARITATFTTSPASVTTTILTNAGATIPGVLYFDSSAQAYSDIGVPTSVAGGQVTFTVPQAGQYLVVGTSATVQRPAVYGRVVVVQNDNQSRTYAYNNNKFFLALQSSGSGVAELTIQNTASSATPPPSGRSAFGAFYNVTLTGAGSFSATLTQKYTASELLAAGISNAQTLRFAVKTNGAWQFPASGASVDTSASTFSQTTTSFSEWGTFGNTTTSDAGSVLFAHGVGAGYAMTLLLAAVAGVLALFSV